VCPLTRDLAGIRVERRRARMAVDALDVDLAGVPLPLLERGPAGVADGSGRHPGHPRGRRRPGRADRRRRGRGQRDRVGAELGPRHLQDHVRDPLADFCRGAVDLGGAVGTKDHARGREVVETLGVADVLEADGEADATPDALAPGRVSRAARQADRLPRQLLRLRHRQLGGAPDHLSRRQRALDQLAGGQGVARPEGVQEPELDRVDPERRGELVHLRLGGETGLHRPEAAHRPAGRVVRVDARRLDQRIRDLVGAEREARRVRGDGGRARGVGTAVEQDPHPHVDELAGARRAVLAPDPRGMAVHVAEERLLAVVDDLHGPLGVESQHRAVDLHREVLATAERTADPREVDAHHLGRQAEARRHLVAIDVQPLRRDVDVHAAFSVRNGET
jgi:hypothetical protein